MEVKSYTKEPATLLTIQTKDGQSFKVVALDDSKDSFCFVSKEDGIFNDWMSLDGMTIRFLFESLRDFVNDENSVDNQQK